MAAMGSVIVCCNCPEQGQPPPDPWPEPIPGDLDYSGTVTPCNMTVTSGCGPEYPPSRSIREYFYVLFQGLITSPALGGTCCPDSTISDGDFIELRQSGGSGSACQWGLAASIPCDNFNVTFITMNLVRTGSSSVACSEGGNRTAYQYDLNVNVDNATVQYTFRNTDFFGHGEDPQEFEFVSYSGASLCDQDTPFGGSVWVY